MPDGLSALDALFVLGALVFGFGAVKFMLSVRPPPKDGDDDRPDAPPPA